MAVCHTGCKLSFFDGFLQWNLFYSILFLLVHFYYNFSNSSFSQCLNVLLFPAPVNTEGISQPTPVMMAMTGSTVTLECFLSEKTRTDPIVWYKQSVAQMPLLVGSAQHFLPSVLYNEFNNSRFFIHNGSVSFRLSISNIQSSDEAFYFCGVRITFEIRFGNGTYLLVEGTLSTHITCISIYFFYLNVSLEYCHDIENAYDN